MCLSQVGPARELFPNGGLERNDGRGIPGFDLSEFGVSLDRTQAHTGAWSVKAQCDGGHADFSVRGFARWMYNQIDRHGARVATTEVKGGRDANGVQRVHVAALSCPGGERALVVVVNDGFRPKTIRVAGLGSRTGHHYWYDATLPDGLQRAKDVDPAKETITVRPLSVNAFTTWAFDRLNPTVP